MGVYRLQSHLFPGSVRLMDNNNWRTAQGGGEQTMDTSDWRTPLQNEPRQRIVNKIMETLKWHLPFSGQEGLEELRKISIRFEEKMFTAATSQSDYLRKISQKMLTMESKSPNTMVNSLPSNSTSTSKNPADSDCHQQQNRKRGNPRASEGGEREREMKSGTEKKRVRRPSGASQNGGGSTATTPKKQAAKQYVFQLFAEKEKHKENKLKKQKGKNKREDKDRKERDRSGNCSSERADSVH